VKIESTGPIKRLAVAVVATLALCGMGAAMAQSAKPFTVSVIYGPDKPQAKVWYRFRDIVNEKVPGQFDIKVVTDGALGGEKETTEGIRLGSVHGALSTLANLTTWVPEGALFDMPFMFRDGEHIDKVMAGPIGDEYKQFYENQGFKVLGFITYGSRQVISKEPIRVSRKMSPARKCECCKVRCISTCGVRWVPIRRRCRSPRPTMRCRPVWSITWT
jgi:TRAP-type transport system periplasmic protein